MSPSVARRLLAFELTRLVAVSGVRHGELGKRLGQTRAAVSQVLVGKNLPTRPALEVMLGYLGASDRFTELSELLLLARGDVNRVRDRVLPYEVGSSGWLVGDAGLLLGLEASADSVDVFDTMAVTSLLQTAEYARRVAEPAGIAAVLVDCVWKRRQGLIAADAGLRLRWVVEERALRRPVCGGSDMTEQWAHVLLMSQRRNVTVRVIPDGIGVHAGLPGQFRVYRSEHWAVVCEQTRSQVLYCAESDVVTNYAGVMADLLLAALGEDESRELLAVLAGRERADR